MMLDVVNGVVDFLGSIAPRITEDVLFVIALAVEALIVIFFLIKSAYSYEACLNRSLDKINFWLFERKMITEENIREFNDMLKAKGPKRLCYYWQQYILFREGTPSSYMSTDNLVEKPLKTSSYNSNIKNLNLISTVWAIIMAIFFIVLEASGSAITADTIAGTIFVVALIYLLNLIFTIYLRARKNALLNSLYQSVSLFGRFMDNACVDLPSYIDYQILFTPQEIEKGQPVLREFLDYKARREKEEFNKAKENNVEYEKYDFSSVGVNGSVVLDRAMKESEIYLKKKEKMLVKIAQLESELDTRKKNFDNIQKDYQNKLQASKENVDRLLQQQEETTNRIESNYLRKQQTQEIAKQEQLEQEFEQQRARYLLEKNECEEEIKRLELDLEDSKKNVEQIMLGEYQTFFNNFCSSAEKVVTTVFSEKLNNLKSTSEQQQQQIAELEIKLKNTPQGTYDATTEEKTAPNGKYDENGNFVYDNGTYYDKDGYFHDTDGNIYDASGNFIRKEEKEEEEKKVVDLDSLDAFDYVNDVSERDDVFNVAENVIENIDENAEVKNSGKKLNYQNPAEEVKQEEKQEAPLTAPTSDNNTVFPDENVKEAKFEIVKLDDEENVSANEQESTLTPVVVKEKPKVKRGRPRKIVKETETKPKGKPGRPRKNPTEQVTTAEKKKPGRPKKTTEEVAEKKKPGRPKKAESSTADKNQEPTKKRGRPRKIVSETAEEKPKGKRGRPRKNIESLEEINKKISEERNKLSEMRDNLNREFETVIKNLEEANLAENNERREEITKEIERLQDEAEHAKGKESEGKISEINAKLEALIEEVKKLNS